MNSDKPVTLVPAEFGAPFEGGFYGGTIRSGEKAAVRLQDGVTHDGFPEVR